MNKEDTVREIFVIHKGGIPLAHVGTGHIEVDDALLGGLLSAIDDVGRSLGLADAGALDTISFRAYQLIYVDTPASLVVLLSSAESNEFFKKSKEELQAIGDELEKQGLLVDTSARTSEYISKMTKIIASKGRTIFAKQHDVFFWDDEHTFQLVKGINRRWDGDNLFSNYLLRSPILNALSVDSETLRALCNYLGEMRRPSEIMGHKDIEKQDARLIEDTMHFLHMLGVVHCYESRVAR
jgi:hypothetical protein